MEIIAPDKRIAKRAAFLQHVLRQKDSEIPAFDTLVAATALETNAVLLSKDEHFERVNDLQTTKW